jgi:hypothetical protein
MIFTPDLFLQQNKVLFGLIRLSLWLPDNRCKTLASFCYYAIIRKIFFPAAYSGASILGTYALMAGKIAALFYSFFSF